MLHARRRLIAHSAISLADPQFGERIFSPAIADTTPVIKRIQQIENVSGANSQPAIRYVICPTYGAQQPDL
jgi:hypothetical protein